MIIYCCKSSRERYYGMCLITHYNPIMANICVFCGSRPGTHPAYLQMAYELGETLAKRWHTLIYGGGSRGLMGAVATGAIKNGWHVIWVVPRFLEEKEREWRSFIESEIIYIDSMDERKTLLYGKWDAVITLPGWVGTMDEFFEVLTLRQLEQHEKPLGVLNIENYYTPLIEYMHSMVEAGFLSVWDIELLIVRDEIESLLDGMGL